MDDNLSLPHEPQTGDALRVQPPARLLRLVLFSFLCHAAVLYLLYTLGVAHRQEQPTTSIVMVQLHASAPAYSQSPPARTRQPSPPVQTRSIVPPPRAVEAPLKPAPPTQAKPQLPASQPAQSAGPLREAPAIAAAPTATKPERATIASGSVTTKTTQISTQHTEEGAPQEVLFGSASAPAFLKQVAPVYPALARRRGKGGVVLLRLHISKTGQLTKVDLLEDPGFGLGEAALMAVQASSFTPGYHNGKPVAMRATLPVRFTLH